MITTALLTVVNVILMAALLLFPSYSPNIQSPAWTMLAAANIVLPIDVWVLTTGIAIAAMAAGLGVWAVKMIVNVIRGSGA
jgi:hypothetical protein